MDKTASRLYTIFFGIIILIVSSLYQIPGGIRLNLLLYPQIGVFSVLGFFHAYNIIRFKNFNKNEKKSTSITAYEVLDLITNTLIYTAWYNVILFPLSGFGIIEWTGVFIILISGFISDLAGTDFSYKKDIFSAAKFLGHSPITLLLTGVALYLFKIAVFYLLPANIYLEAFHGNFLARTIIVFFCLCGLITMVSLLVKNVRKNISGKKELSDEEKAKIKDSTKKFFKKCWNGIKKIVTKLAAVVSGPVFIIILIIAGLFVVGIAAAFALNIYNSILKFVEPVMEQLLKTGKALVTPSKFYGLCQTISLIAVLFYSILDSHSLKTSE